MEEKDGGEKVRLGMVVCYVVTKRTQAITRGYRANQVLFQVIRGNSVVMLEALERIGGGDK